MNKPLRKILQNIDSNKTGKFGVSAAEEKISGSEKINLDNDMKLQVNSLLAYIDISMKLTILI